MYANLYVLFVNSTDGPNDAIKLLRTDFNKFLSSLWFLRGMFCIAKKNIDSITGLILSLFSSI